MSISDRFLVLLFVVSIIVSPLLLNKQEQVVEVTQQPAPPVIQEIESDSISQTEMECLALNVYFEARNQDVESQLAVTMVVLNRAQNSFWPDHICDVVKQGSYRDGYVSKNKCQFSWYCDGLPDRPYEKETWQKILNVVDDGYYIWSNGYDITNGATNYHAKYVKPAWGNDYNMHYVTTIGDHLFYRWATDETVALRQ